MKVARSVVLSAIIMATAGACGPSKATRQPLMNPDDHSSINGEALRDRNRRVVHAFFERLESFDIEGFAALFAESGRQVMPFAPTGFPRELNGRAAIFNQYRGMPQNFSAMRFPGLLVQDMLDPSRFLATYRGEIELRAGGQYNNTYAGIFVIGDGHIVEFTEYFDPGVLERAFGAALKDNFNLGPEGSR
jgi:uncharacterized protein